MKEIVKVFESESVRCFEKKGEPYFSVLDVCKVLGLSNSREQTSKLSENDIDYIEIIDRLHRKQTLTVINEPALYQLIFRSRKRTAYDFIEFVTHNILPKAMEEKIKDFKFNIYGNEGYIYLIERDKRYKIGRTINPKEREHNYKTEAPDKYKLLICVKVNDCYKSEMELHRKYKKYKYRGEWYKIDGDYLLK